MGGNHQFGKLGYVRRQVWYTLSPYELSPLRGFIKKGFPNMLRRIAQELPYIAPPMLIAYAVYSNTMQEKDKLERKKPGEFDN